METPSSSYPSVSRLRSLQQQNYLPSMASHASSPTMVSPKAAGDTWLHDHEGQLWPVILCGDDIPPPAFVESRPPGFVYPAILLGKLKYIWVSDARLVDFNPSTRYIEAQAQTPSQSTSPTSTNNVNSKSEDARRKAFLEDALQFKTPAYWKNYIEQRSQVRKLEHHIATKRKPSTGVVNDIASTSLSFLGTRKKQRRQIWDRRPPTPPFTPVKGRLGNGTNRPKNDLDSDDDSLFVRQTRSQSDPFVFNANNEADDEDGDEKNMKDRSIRKQREENLKEVRADPPGDDTCTIFVGEAMSFFFAPREEVDECPFLSERSIITEELGHHIDLSRDTNIEADDFGPIAQYLQQGDFAPCLVEIGGQKCLEGVMIDDVSEKEKREAMMQIAKVFNTANEMHFAALQWLCVNKLKAICSVGAKYVLVAAALLYEKCRSDSEVDSHVQEWLIDLLAEHFWTLVAKESLALERIVGQNEELRRRLFRKMGKGPDLGKEGLQADHLNLSGL